MKKALSIILAAVLILSLFTACKKGGEKEETTTVKIETTVPLVAKDGKSFDEIKAAFEKAFSGQGYTDLEACFIDNPEKYYEGIIEFLQVVYQNDEFFTIPAYKDGVAEVFGDSSAFSKLDKTKIKIDWDSNENASDMFNKYYGGELSDEAREESDKRLVELNRLITANTASELYEFTNLISFSAEIEGLQKDKCELRGFVLETEKGCFLIAFDKNIFLYI